MKTIQKDDIVFGISIGDVPILMWTIERTDDKFAYSHMPDGERFKFFSNYETAIDCEPHFPSMERIRTFKVFSSENEDGFYDVYNQYKVYKARQFLGCFDWFRLSDNAVCEAAAKVKSLQKECSEISDKEIRGLSTISANRAKIMMQEAEEGNKPIRDLIHRLGKEYIQNSEENNNEKDS